MVLKWTRTKPEPLKYFEPELNLNPNRYLKRFDTLVYNEIMSSISSGFMGFFHLNNARIEFWHEVTGVFLLCS